MGLIKKNKVKFINSDNSIKNEYDYLVNINNKKLVKDRTLLEHAVKTKENIENTLKESNLDISILINLNINYGGRRGVFDYIVVTDKNVYILFSKDLYGNIEVNEKKEFICNIDIENTSYSYNLGTLENRINTNMEILKSIGYIGLKMVDRIIFSQEFYTYYKPIILIGSNDYEINYFDDNKIDNVVKINELIDYIKINDKNTKHKFNKKERELVVENIFNKNIPDFGFYEDKYEEILKDINSNCNSNKLIKELKNYRYYISKRDNIDLYKIYSDKIINELVKYLPCDKEDLLNMGINKYKVNKYGDKIIEIISKNRGV